ncbi:hypothetical protein [Undibacterium luofuense]|uniref:Uncharacterized protein n=1 Tax=Undibacterium luofuense TaxID=2828733 RepID=A0A941DJM7_9BURK|nr:hypothetical protein [Undibacterium luofuense]MBR7781200.1 hypothetical protein [Undibacterium luofuense]
MNKVNLLLMRFVILAVSAFVAVLLALLPSLFVQYALPFADQWYSGLSHERQETILWLLRVLIPSLGIFAVLAGLFQIISSVKRKKNNADYLTP